jgi:hypothetical protein
MDAIRRGASCEELVKAWQPGLRQFVERRRDFLLYSE